jgi:hypothetical protein
LFGGDVALPAENHTVIIEFRVADMDTEVIIELPTGGIALPRRLDASAVLEPSN